MDLSDNNTFDDRNDYNEDGSLVNLRDNIKKNKNLDYILGVVEEEIALLRDKIEEQGREIRNVKKRLNSFDKIIKK